MEYLTSDWRLAAAAMIAVAMLAKHVLKFIKDHDQLYELAAMVGSMALIFLTIPLIVLAFTIVVRLISAVSDF